MDEVDFTFTRPQSVDWDLFEDAIVQIVYSWDIIEHALDDEWGGDATDETLELVIDYLLSNFAERWLEGRGAKPDSVAEFLTDTIMDHFEVEVPASLAFPIAKLMVTLHEECFRGVRVGVTVVLGESRVLQLTTTTSDQDVKRQEEDVLVINDKVQQDEVVLVTNENGKQDEVEKSGGGVEEEDGWTTVVSKPKLKKKNKGKQLD